MTGSPEEISRGERWAYAMGDTGFNFTWATIELYLLFYYIKIVGLEPEIAGLIFLAGAAVDLVADPAIGSFIDRHSRIGLRRFVMLATPALGLALAATFIVSGGGGEFPWAMLAAHLILRLSYSAGNIPYAALTARMTSVPQQQVALTATRMQGAAIGGLIATSLYLMLPLDTAPGEGLGGIPTGVIILAVLSQPLLLFSMMSVRERVEPTGKQHSSADNGSVAENLLQLVARHITVRHLLALVFILGLAITLLHKSLLFIFDAMDLRELGYAIAVTPALALLIAAPLWGRLARKYGSKAVLQFSVVVFSVCIALAALGSAWAYVALVLLMLAVFLGAGLSTVFWALVPQVISSLEMRAGAAGQAVAGRLAGLANLSRKLAQAAAPQLIALSMWIGDTTFLMMCAGVALVAVMVVFFVRVPGGDSAGDAT